MKPTHGLFKDITGQRFGRLTVINYAGRNKTGRHRWECVCSCGNKVTCIAYNLGTENTKSCGCLKLNICSETHKTHGMRQTRFYAIYMGIKKRCENQKDIGYYLYGGRGIKDEWTCFEQFKDEMYESYQQHVKDFGEKNTSIDRIDVNGDYCKENCRWATNLEQGRNTRRNRYLTYMGKTKCLVEWAEEIGISPKTLSTRLCKGWETEKALTTPVGKNGRTKVAL